VERRFRKIEWATWEGRVVWGQSSAVSIKESTSVALLAQDILHLAFPSTVMKYSLIVDKIKE